MTGVTAKIAAARAEQWKRPECDRVDLTLPTPPSVNALWRRGKRGIIRSEKYTQWADAAGIYINRRKPGRVSGWFTAHILIEWTRAGRDIDNLGKATMDLLQAHGIIENDSLCWQVTLGWSLEIEGAQVVLEKVTAGLPALPSSSREAAE